VKTSKTAVFSHVAPCTLIQIDQYLRDNMHLWNVRQYLSNYKVQHPRRQPLQTCHHDNLKFHHEDFRSTTKNKIPKKSPRQLRIILKLSMCRRPFCCQVFLSAIKNVKIKIQKTIFVPIYLFLYGSETWVSHIMGRTQRGVWAEYLELEGMKWQEAGENWITKRKSAFEDIH
jgi:hypothetical protein